MRKVKQRSSKAFLEKIQKRREAMNKIEEEKKRKRLECLEKMGAHAAKIKDKQRMRIYSPGHKMHGDHVYIIDDSNAPALICIGEFWYRSGEIVVGQDNVVTPERFDVMENSRISEIEKDAGLAERVRGISESVFPVTSILPLILASSIHQAKR